MVITGKIAEPDELLGSLQDFDRCNEHLRDQINACLKQLTQTSDVPQPKTRNTRRVRKPQLDGSAATAFAKSLINQNLASLSKVVQAVQNSNEAKSETSSISLKQRESVVACLAGSAFDAYRILFKKAQTESQDLTILQNAFIALLTRTVEAKAVSLEFLDQLKLDLSSFIPISEILKQQPLIEL